LTPENRVSLSRRLAARSGELVLDYERRLASINSDLLADDLARAQCLQVAREVIDDVVRCFSVSSSGSLAESSIDASFAHQVGDSRANGGIHPNESLRAAEILFEVVLGGVRQLVAAEPDAGVLISVAAEALHHTLMARIRFAAGGYTSFLLNRVTEAHMLERRRLAREIHDRLGSEVSAGARSVEVAEFKLHTDPAEAQLLLARAGEALREASENIRRLAQDLQMRTFTNGLEDALRRSIELLVSNEADIRVEVSGDESWVPPAVLDEFFLVVREAIRNSLTHGRPQCVSVHIDIAPHEVRASVADNGVGFDLAGERGPGVGISSMAERVEALGGLLHIFSLPGHGTSVEAKAPLGRPTHAV
jgi:signal transduction histidine kinase